MSEEEAEMQSRRSKLIRPALAAIAAALAAVALAAPAGAAVPVIQTYMPSFAAPQTPAIFNQVGVIKVGPPQARNVLVLEPGTSAGAGYFVPFAKWLTERTKGWQVWSVERRENLLEDQSVLTAAKFGLASPQELYNYYLGYLTNPSISFHFNPVPESSVGFARQWGMNVAVQDLHTVIEAAKALGGKVVLGGHSLGGSVVTAYATWDFGGKPGADGLSGLVYDDGGSSPFAISKETAEGDLTALAKKSPWLAFGGIEAPFLGIFSALGSTLTVIDPKGESLLERFPFLPPPLRSKIAPVTNEAGFGYSVNLGTSPASLIAAQIHGGEGVEEIAEADGLHGWNGAGALTPVQRYAEMLSGTGLPFADGSEWYFPERLTIDTGAVADGIFNQAQEVLGEHAIHGRELPTSLKILAIDSELDKLLQGNTLEAAVGLANLSGIPLRNLTLIDEEAHYAHNDPAGAFPNNEFFNQMVPFLEGIG
jgi:pimeloyl-ACP methyl ester carboxylesterase